MNASASPSESAVITNGDCGACDNHGSSFAAAVATEPRNRVLLRGGVDALAQSFQTVSRVREKGLPVLQIRVGAEHGYSKVKLFSNPATGFKAEDTGDGLMGYFCNGGAGEPSAQKAAVAASLSIFAISNAILNQVIIASGLAKVDFRICIDHGFITIAEVGAARRFRGIVAIGTTANVAYKMLAVAEPNTLLLGDQVTKGIPQEWQQYLRVKTADSGWVYKTTGAPYLFWEYTGRWILPL
jgi:adenylate cyclase